MIFNQKGQALIESVFVLPSIIGLITLALGGLFLTGHHYLTDHFVYQSALCLAQEKPLIECKRELKKNLSLIPFSKVSIQRFYVDRSQALVELTSLLPWQSKRASNDFSEQLFLPLTVKQFEDAL